MTHLIVFSSNLASHQNALKLSAFIISTSSMALVLKNRAGKSLIQTTRSHLNIALSKFAKVPCLNLWRFELPPFFVASKILSLSK